MPAQFQGQIEQIDANRWRIPRSARPGMRVDGIIYASKALIGDILSGGGPDQVANVATLPGIVSALPGHAGHPLGLRLLHRRGGRHRSVDQEGGRHLPRRSRL